MEFNNFLSITGGKAHYYRHGTKRHFQRILTGCPRQGHDHQIQFTP